MKKLLTVVAVLALTGTALAGGGLYEWGRLEVAANGLAVPLNESANVGMRAFGITMLWVSFLAAGLGMLGLMLKDMLRDFPQAWRRFVGIK